MFETIAMKRGALALLLASAVVGAAEAQTPQPNSRPSARCTGAPFPLSDGTARFHVALDDHSSEPGIYVVMRFINQAGTIVRAGAATIGPGGSATLDLPRGSGLYRVQAEAFEPLMNVHFSDRRTILASLYHEFRAVGSGLNDLLGNDIIFQWIGPGPIVPCAKFNLQTQ